MKATAWPALLIVGVLFAVRDAARPASRFALTALAVVGVLAGPVLANEPVALIQNTQPGRLGSAAGQLAAADHRSPVMTPLARA